MRVRWPSSHPAVAIRRSVAVFALAAASCGLAHALRDATVRANADGSALAAVGRLAFFDASLSASHKVACATCHDPAHAFAPANASPVQLGGPDTRRQGTRAVPSLLYLQGTIPFIERRFGDDDGGDADDAAPAGGLTWDGRVDTLHEQALIPLFNAKEMANSDAAALSRRVERAAWADSFRALFDPPGGDVFARPDEVVRDLALALEAYQRQPEFQPFSSKYDAFLLHEATLSKQEMRGLALYDDPQKGNCASCHPDTMSPRGAMPLFTDFSHVAIGVPRNRQLAVNNNPARFDLGLCGPDRTDLARHADFCGAFMTPTLRNVATRKSFFHNGVFHSLHEVMAWYVQRDTNPERWYSRDADGHVRKYDDLPPAYRRNVNSEVPFKPTDAHRPRLNEREIADVIAFLGTLTDGYRAPSNRAAPYPASAHSTPAPSRSNK